MQRSIIGDEDVNALFKAILKLKTEEECAGFFDDLCTIGELQAITQRYAVARRLDEGETYSAIAEKTGASSATISRVNRCLVYGSGGYRIVLDRIKG